MRATFRAAAAIAAGALLFVSLAQTLEERQPSGIRERLIRTIAINPDDEYDRSFNQ